MKKYNEFINEGLVTENMSRDAMVNVIKNILTEIKESDYISDRSRYMMIGHIIGKFSEKLFTNEEDMNDFYYSIMTDQSDHRKIEGDKVEEHTHFIDEEDEDYDFGHKGHTDYELVYGIIDDFNYITDSMDTYVTNPKLDKSIKNVSIFLKKVLERSPSV